MLTVEQLGNLTGKKVMVRVDFNFTLKCKEIRFYNRNVFSFAKNKKIVVKRYRVVFF